MQTLLEPRQGLKTEAIKYSEKVLTSHCICVPGKVHGVISGPAAAH